MNCPCLRLLFWILVAGGSFSGVMTAAETERLPIEQKVTHAFASNNGVRIHYASPGQGPLIVMIHGFPDYWLTWRHQMEAFQRSDFEAMLNYYKRNYPREPYAEDASPLIKVKCPVLMIHGLKDTALLSGALHDNWDYVEQDLTLVTIPEAGHFVQQDAADLVTRSMKAWLSR